jgi:probable HAF family extracellular repeat protein
LKIHGATIAALAACLAAGEARADQPAPLFIELRPGALAYAVGANGFVVAGTFFEGRAFHWMPASTLTEIGGIKAVAVSRDGKTIVGTAFDQAGLENAAIWTDGQSWRRLGSVRPNALPCDRLLSSAFDASGDGRVVVGLAWDGCGLARAFRWEESTGMVDLGSLGGRSTRGSAVSGDGRVVVGFEEAPNGFRQGAKWVDGREELIRGPSGGVVGEAQGVNRDGSVIAGTHCEPDDFTKPPSAWTWTAGVGVKCFPVVRPAWALPLAYNPIMQAMSDDGRVIGGALSFGLDAEAMVWLDGEQWFLRDYLRAHGVRDAFDGWYNTGFVNDVSADGRVLVGFGAGRTNFQGYIVVLPEPDRR